MISLDGFWYLSCLLGHSSRTRVTRAAQLGRSKINVFTRSPVRLETTMVHNGNWKLLQPS